MKLFKFLFLISILTLINCNPVKDDSNENDEDENTCKSLCEHCGCKGFYCGEECICECVQDTDEDVECLETMKSNCDKMDLNFDMVYQGSKGYRFVRESNKIHNIDEHKEEVLRQQRSIDNLPNEHQMFVHLVDEPVAPAAPAIAETAPVVGAPAAATIDQVPVSPVVVPEEEIVGSPPVAAAAEDVGMAKSATSMIIPTKTIAFQPFFNKNKFVPPPPPPPSKSHDEESMKYSPRSKFAGKNLDIMEALKQGKVIVIAKRPKDKGAISKLGSSNDLVGSPQDGTLIAETVGAENPSDTETVGMSKPTDLIKKNFINDFISKKRAKDYAEKKAKVNYELSKDKYIIDKAIIAKSETLADKIKANKIASAIAKKRFTEISKLTALMKSDKLLKATQEDSIVGAPQAPTTLSASEASIVGSPAAVETQAETVAQPAVA